MYIKKKKKMKYLEKKGGIKGRRDDRVEKYSAARVCVCVGIGDRVTWVTKNFCGTERVGNYFSWINKKKDE